MNFLVFDDSIWFDDEGWPTVTLLEELEVLDSLSSSLTFLSDSEMSKMVRLVDVIEASLA